MTAHVMLVDDEAPLVYLLTRTLKKLGYEVSGFTDPEEAVRSFCCAPASYDSVVVDFAMPSKTGFEVASEMRAVRPDVPIVMMSGYLRAEDRERAMAIGVRELVLKPDICDELALILHKLLGSDKKGLETPP